MREVLGKKIERSTSDPARFILAALVGLHRDEELDVSILDSLTPETVLQLDLIVGDVIDQGREKEAVQAIRAAVLRSIN